MSCSDSITSSFELIQSIQSDIIEAYNLLFDISENVKREREIHLLQLPYHINVIDELHINENAHSRILAKLLQFKNSNGQYEILTSFIDFVKSKRKSTEFDKITIEDPVITQEIKRIDLWVRDYSKKCALIFENKIYDATDQEAQLYRYIEKTRNDYRYRFKDDEIFVFYLTQYGGDPCEQTWGDDKTKQTFLPRYMALSFRDDVLMWLKNKVIPNIQQKDSYLLNAVSQYVDYLEGLFSLREINKPLNMHLQKIISEKLGLESCGEKEALNKIEEVIKDFQEVLNQLESMQSDIIVKQKSERRTFWREHISLARSQADTLSKELGLASEVGFYNELDSHFYISFKKKEWELPIVFERKDNESVFIFIGHPGERRVNEQYQNSGIYIFKEHSAPQTDPYGWEYIDKYHQAPDILVQDIRNESFKVILSNELSRILKEITDKNIKMRVN